MRESRQESLTKELLEVEGVLYRKDGRQGWPDRLALVGHHLHIWVEHKTEIGRLTAAQKRVFPKLLAIGDIIVYAKGMTPEQIAAKVLSYHGRLVSIL